MENRVNYLDGKNWLKNAVNFYEFDKFDLQDIQQRFYDFCFKDRTGGKVSLQKDNQTVGDYDFSFRYIERDDYNSLNQQLKLIYHSSYNSYHVILLNDIIDTDGFLISNYITNFTSINNLEYRGRIIIHIKESNQILPAFLLLNRVDEKNEIVFPDKCNYYVRQKRTSEYVITSKSKIDKIGLKHPAPYSYFDINSLIDIENIHNKTILDPFLGVGSTIFGTYKTNRNIGIELNPEYIDLINQRIALLDLDGFILSKHEVINGDCLEEVDKINEPVHAIITSPPYFNILKNKNKGVRHDNSQSRQGVEYYSDSKKDFGNIETYSDYLDAMKSLFEKCYNKIEKGGSFYLIISDFTIDKKETDIHSSMVRIMNEAGFSYAATSYLFQNQKVIYPFGYPYKIVLNHIFQYVIKFTKE